MPESGSLTAAGSDAITAVIGAVAALVMTGGGLWLERCCLAPEPPSDPDGPSRLTDRPDVRCRRSTPSATGRGRHSGSASNARNGAVAISSRSRRIAARSENARCAATYSALPAAVSIGIGG